MEKREGLRMPEVMLHVAFKNHSEDAMIISLHSLYDAQNINAFAWIGVNKYDTAYKTITRT